MGQNIIDLCSIVLELIRTISEVQFALKDEGAKFPGVGTIKWIGFPKLWLGFGGAVIGCDDMFAGVGGWDGVLVPGIEFPEGSRKVNRSSSPAALREF